MEDSKKPLLSSTICAPSDTAEQNRIVSDSHIVDIKMPKIYKVPPMLRGLSEETYTPRLVTIGPFHYQNNNLLSRESVGNWIKFTESVKEVCFEEISRHIDIKNADICETKTGLKLVEIKHCYAEITFHEFPGDDRDFFLMILRDACFIIKLFQMNQRRDHNGSSSSSDHDHEGLSKILNTPWLKKGIEQDLILLENQLPYFVLCRLYEIYFERASPDKSFTKLALQFFSKGESSSIEKQETKVLHLTDLMRMFLIPIENPKEKSTKNDKAIETISQNPCSATKLDQNHKKQSTINDKNFGAVSQYPCSATKLDTAGIEFVLADKNTPLTQVSSRISAFKLYLPFLPSPKPAKFIFPALEVRDDTVCILRNIVAFEQCHSNYKPYVCSYVLLMHKLIKTREDADLLMEKNIIKHLVGGEDVVNLFATLSRDIEIPILSYYASDCLRINNHYDNKWNCWMASFRRTYLKDAWTIGSTILGIVLFVFSVTSTIKSIFY